MNASDDDPLGGLVLAAVTVAALLIANGLWFASPTSALPPPDAFAQDSAASAASGPSPGAHDPWRLLALVERPPLTDRHQQVVEAMTRFRRMVRPGAVVASAWAGVPAYFSNYKLIDILGYNDRTVAHMDPVVPLDEDHFDTFRPGHTKWNDPRLLGEQRPDAFFQIWGVRFLGRVPEVMARYGYHRVGGFWVRADSPFIVPPPVSAAGKGDPDLAPRRRRQRQQAQAAQAAETPATSDSPESP